MRCSSPWRTTSSGQRINGWSVSSAPRNPKRWWGPSSVGVAPAFVIRSASLESIANRLSYICEEEGIQREPEALTLIAEQSGSHIRDALKMLEGASMAGPLTRQAVASYLHLESNGTILELLGHIGSDLEKAIQMAARISEEISPSVAYERVAEAALLAYQVHLGVASIPSKWEEGHLKTIAEQGSSLLNVAMRFAAPPHRPTSHTLILDTATAHHLFGAPFALPSAASSTLPPVQDHSVSEGSPVSAKTGDATSDPVGKVGHASQTPTAKTTANGVWVDPRAIARGPKTPHGNPSSRQTLSSVAFRELVRHHLCRLVKDGSA